MFLILITIPFFNIVSNINKSTYTYLFVKIMLKFYAFGLHKQDVGMKNLAVFPEHQLLLFFDRNM